MKKGQFIIDVRLVAESRVLPVDAADFDGYWKGSCIIVACPERPQLVGRHMALEMRNAVAHAPYFTLRLLVDSASVNGKSLETPRSLLVLIVGCKSELDAGDLAFLAQELGTPVDGQSAKLEELEAVPGLAPLLYNSSALVRAQYTQPLLMYFSADQRERIDALSTDQLKALTQTLKSEPWSLAFKYPLKALYAKLKPLTLEACDRACGAFALTAPDHVVAALRFYVSICNVKDHTLHTMGPTSMEPMMRAYLEQKAIIFWDAERFALHEHWDDAKRICQALLWYHERAAKQRPQCRNPLQVPCLPPCLQGAQMQAAQTILDRCVTVLEGYPGTGKTAVITWAVAYFSNVLLVTLTGAMASSLRVRNGGRDEVAHTIDHIIHTALYGGPLAREWLARFDVLIIDEFSNVTTPKLAQLLWLLPHLVRVVLVGDHNQIRSRKPGDPLGDLREAFPLIELREILRVSPTLSPLYEVPKVLSEQSVKLLRWSPSGPLTLVEPVAISSGGDDDGASDKLLLRKLLGEIWRLGGRSLMSHQIVVLQNSVRRALNTACHALAIEAGLISSKAHAVQMGGPGQAYCVGTKICFTRNYNKAVEWAEQPGSQRVWHGATVVNGECGVVTRIVALPRRKGWALTFATDSASKTVIVSRHISNAVSPNDMDMGYAITTTKVQGREYRYVIFWNNRGSKATHFWTRAHPYVALTRGKERVWCVSYKRDLQAMCIKQETHRRTVLRALLTHFAPLYVREPVLSAGPFHHADGSIMYALLPASMACVPVMAVAEPSF
jgi:hypothetical protein